MCSWSAFGILATASSSVWALGVRTVLVDLCVSRPSIAFRACIRGGPALAPFRRTARVRPPGRRYSGDTVGHRRRRPEGDAMPRPLPGQVQAVLGAISPETMGVTLPHEHLL